MSLRRTTLGAVLSLVSLFSQTAAADVEEIATLPGGGLPLNWIILSNDGSRLAAAMPAWTSNLTGKPVARLPGEVVVWDVTRAAQVCSCKNANAIFNNLLFSGDAKTLVTVESGIQPSYLQISGKQWELLNGLQSRSFRAWDSDTGRELSSFMAPAGAVFSTVALSPDGKYLAVAGNFGNTFRELRYGTSARTS